MLKYKKIGFFITSSILSLSIISCSQNSEKSFFKYIDQSKDVLDTTLSIEAAKNKKALETLLNKVFINNNAAKIDFVNQQNNPEYQKTFFEKIKKLSSEFSIAPNEKIINNLKEIYSENWYLVLSNLSKFKFQFHNWYILPEQTNHFNNVTVKMTEQYLNNLNSLEKYPSFKFKNNYIDEIKESETSGENSTLSDLIILKDKSLISISLSFLGPNTKVTLDPYLIYFPKAQNKISINLMSYIFHQAIIHQVDFAYREFENDIIQKLRYGIPALMVFTVGDDENE